MRIQLYKPNIPGFIVPESLQFLTSLMEPLVGEPTPLNGKAASNLHIPALISGALVGLVLSLAVLFQLIDGNRLALPPEPGDGPDYDNIAVNLLYGKGFGLDYGDADWRAPYADAAQTNAAQFQDLLTRDGGFHITAYRPPVYPLTLAAVYSAFGRSFPAARLLNVVLFGLSVAIVAYLAFHVGGVAGPFIVGMFAVADPSFILWSDSLQTESLASLLVSIILLLLFKIDEGNRNRLSTVLGVVLAALVLTRFITALWIPFVFLALYFRLPSTAPRLRSLTLFGFALILPIVIWGARNLIVLGTFKPLGTQGGYNLALDYSNAIMETRGVWSSQAQSFVLARIYRDLPPNISATAREVRISEWGARKAFIWIKHNLSALPELFLIKLRALLYEQALSFQKLLVFLTLLALYVVPRNRSLVPAALLLLANVVAVMLTHAVQAGRFLVPMYPSMYLLLAVAISSLLKIRGRHAH